MGKSLEDIEFIFGVSKLLVEGSEIVHDMAQDNDYRIHDDWKGALQIMMMGNMALMRMHNYALPAGIEDDPVSYYDANKEFMFGMMTQAMAFGVALAKAKGFLFAPPDEEVKNG